MAPLYSQCQKRCPCNGPLYYGGWWCDEWICDMCFCTHRYTGLADGDETAFASNIALQAYFEGRTITEEDMIKCIEYWRNNISEEADPVGRKRDVCCEPCYLPWPTMSFSYQHCCHFKRNVPYGDEDLRNTKEVRAVRNAFRVHFNAPS
jgi:hypothetical protein